MPFSSWDQNSLEDLKRAIQQALESGDLFQDSRMQDLLEKLSAMTPEQLDRLLENLVQKLADVLEKGAVADDPGLALHRYAAYVSPTWLVNIGDEAHVGMAGQIGQLHSVEVRSPVDLLSPHDMTDWSNLRLAITADGSDANDRRGA